MLPAGIKKLIKHAKAQKTSDIHVCAGAPILFRVGRDLLPATEAPLTAEITERLATEMLTPEQMELFRRRRDYDLMVSDEEGRYRVNVSYNDQAIGLVVRILPQEALTLDELRLPPVVQELTRHTKGLILITGSTSQGKASTMSGLIRQINMDARRHMRSKDRSQIPIQRMQWWIRPGPSLSWAMMKPCPSAPRRFACGTRHDS